jgi:hypothetical protein
VGGQLLGSTCCNLDPAMNGGSVRRGVADHRSPERVHLVPIESSHTLILVLMIGSTVGVVVCAVAAVLIV